jgi:ATP-dependent helicase/nuclease subunit B
VQIQFLIGPAGSGKTHRCLAEIRAELTRSAEGPPLILLAPKQATFQLERQLLADDSLCGYTRLHILSFDRLARFIFEQLGQPDPQLLGEEGRLMVLRALLVNRRDELKLFRASARLTGFAQQLSHALHEFQQNLLTPDALLKLANNAPQNSPLALKLHDLAALLRDYLDWLKARDLQDADRLLAVAAEALRKSEKCEVRSANGNHAANVSLLTSPFSLHVDGFAEFSPSELELLVAFVSHCQRATIAFCLDPKATENNSSLSNWSLVRKTFEEAKKRLGELSDAKISVEQLHRNSGKTRFAGNTVLAHLEKFWNEPERFTIYDVRDASEAPQAAINSQLRLAACANAEAEAVVAAREILHFVRDGGRFRDASVIVRNLEGYHDILQRVFSRYEIPFFLDRRESVSHHPLTELTRSAMRIAAFNWAHEDFFAALKTGLVRVDEAQLDRLENEALARGWKGATWRNPIQIPDNPALEKALENFRQEVVPPFKTFVATLAEVQNKPTGEKLSDALRELWRALNVEETLTAWSSASASHTIHSTVWDQLNAWLENLSLAFSSEPLSLREWLPILEAGLGNLAVGAIPPALDQVLVGAIDRSRNPDIRLALVLGLNEGVFPAPPPAPVLLTESDRDELARRGIALGTNARMHIARERYFGYIACTRARQRLVLTSSAFGRDDKPLNPSPLLSRIKHLFPQLEIETVPRTFDWREAEHASELIAPLLQIQNSNSIRDSEKQNLEQPSRRGLAKPQFEIRNWERLAEIPSLKSTLDRLQNFRFSASSESLPPELANQLYGKTLRTSVSRLEQFAACPFRFFVHSGLRAEERKLFELDIREKGNFQHEVLKEFHEQLRRENKRWRDITPREARERIAKIAQLLAANYRDGLLHTSDETKFTARVLTASLQDFIETLVAWMREQYEFDPVAVELPFGENDGNPAWELDLGDGRRLALRGRIDRVDLCRNANGEALCVVLDYKSSAKKLDSLFVENGLQLQLLAYLNVLRRWPNAREFFAADRIIPAGVFYVNLRGKFERAKSRGDALDEIGERRKSAYQHSGRFDSRALRKLDSRENATIGDQFKYKKNNDGNISKVSREAMQSDEFAALLDSVEANLKKMGGEIFAGKMNIAPFRKGAMTACDQCDYQSICRIDPWTHQFRTLRAEEK